MNIDFGTGPRLIDVHPDLKDPEKRIAMILDVAERNSVIEGLPPFTPELREQLRQELLAQAATTTTEAPAESQVRSDHKPGTDA